MAPGDHRGCQGGIGAIGAVGGALEVAGGLGAQPHRAPVQGPITPTGSP